MKFGSAVKGYYDLLREPYCKKCAYPGVTTSECIQHDEDYGYERTYAMGRYLPVRLDPNYEDLLSNHIRGLKRYRNYARPLGLAISICVKNRYPKLLRSDSIVPVPKHKDEVEPPKFNQAAELAKSISEGIGIPLADILHKKAAHRQRDLSSRVARREKVKGLYVCKAFAQAEKRKLIVVDDIRTSGGTSSECAKALVDAGAKDVDVLVAGRDVLER